MKNFICILLGCAALLLAACSRTSVRYEPCHAEGMTASAVAVRSQKLLDSEIELGEVGGGQRTNPRIASNVGNAGFRKALRFSLTRSGLYSENADLVLDAMILDEKITSRTGKNISVEEKVRYVLRERSSGKTIYSANVLGNGTATSKIRVKDRLRAAKERAMRRNIQNFLTALDRAFLKSENRNSRK